MTSPIGTAPIGGGGGGGGGGIMQIVGIGMGVQDPLGPVAILTATAASVGATTPQGAIDAVQADSDLRRIDLQTPAANPTGIYVSYLALSTAAVGGPVASPGPLAGGTYDVRLNILAGGALAAAGTDIELQIVIDGFIFLQGPLQDFGVIGGRFGFFAGFSGLAFPPGDHVLDLQFRQDGGPGTAQIQGADWSIRRVGP